MGNSLFLLSILPPLLFHVPRDFVSLFMSEKSSLVAVRGSCFELVWLKICEPKKPSALHFPSPKSNRCDPWVFSLVIPDVLKI